MSTRTGGGAVWQAGPRTAAGPAAGRGHAVRGPGPEPPGAASAADKIERLLSGLEDLTSRQPVVAGILRTVDAPRSGAADLAAAVSGDPGLSGRLMRLANSAYFGLSGRVSSLQFAVTAVGFATVRALAVSCATGMSGTQDVPDGYWEHACAQAVAAGLVAAPVGAGAPDAFCAGLLADLGRGLLFRADPDACASLLTRAGSDPADQLIAERDWFGTTHPQVSARLLGAWSLPRSIVDAVAEHHVQPSDRTDPLVVAVRVGAEMAHRVVHGRPAASLRTVSRGRIADDSPLLGQVAAQSSALLTAFAGS